MSKLYDRRCVVLVGVAPEPGDRYLRSPDALRIEGLSMQFRVARDLHSTPNQGEISIFNLSPESRAKLEGVGQRVVIEAGYQGAEAVIFSGDVRRGWSMKQGADWVTKLEAGDGERSLAWARVNESYKPGTKLKEVLQRSFKALVQDPGNALQKAEEIAGEFVSGYAQSAPAVQEINRLLPDGWTWSIQDGRVEVLGPGDTLSEAAVVLSPESGLIGTPTVASPSKPKEPSQMRCRSLLSPRSRPGMRLELKSDSLNGTYKILRVTHTGATHGGDWYTDIEAHPL